MITPSTYRIELLDPAKHRREEFDCGVEILNDYLKRRANQEMKALAAACYVIVPDNDPGRIAGYYALSATSIGLTQLPETLRKKLPRYDQLGAVLVGRLARDTAFPSERIGEPKEENGGLARPRQMTQAQRHGSSGGLDSGSPCG